MDVEIIFNDLELAFEAVLARDPNSIRVFEGALRDARKDFLRIQMECNSLQAQLQGLLMSKAV